MDREKFGKFIANARRELGLTQQELADQLHVTDKAVSKWERGLCYPDLTVLESLAAALGLTVAELMACEKRPEEAACAGCSEKDMSSLLEIAAESQKQQKKRIWLFVCLLALASIVLTGSIFLWAAANASGCDYVTFAGKKSNADGYFVYVEKNDRLLCLSCTDPQLYDTIETGRKHIYSIEYSWNRFTYQGTLDRCQEEETNVVGTAMDEMGSAIGVDSLLGIDCAIKSISGVYPDPDREGKYLYTFRYYYEGDGTRYYLGGDEPQIHMLTVQGCRGAASADFDGDGITELFVLTKYEEEPYMLYDLENGEIVCYFVDEVPDGVLKIFRAIADDRADE